jgi:hypothetical protein
LTGYNLAGQPSLFRLNVTTDNDWTDHIWIDIESQTATMGDDLFDQLVDDSDMQAGLLAVANTMISENATDCTIEVEPSLTSEAQPLNVTFLQIKKTPGIDKETDVSATINIMKAKKAQAAGKEGTAVADTDTQTTIDKSTEALPVDNNPPPVSTDLPGGNDGGATEAMTTDASVTSGDTGQVTGDSADDMGVTLAEEAAPKKTTKKVTTATAAKAKVKAPAQTDVIISTANEIENMSESAATGELRDLLDTQAFDTFRIGGILSKIQTEGWFGEHPNFRSLVEAEFDIKYRTAMMYVALYNDMVNSNVPWDKVKGLGWTKAAILAPIMTPDNIDSILASVDGMGTVAVRAYASQFDAAPTSTAATASPDEVSTLKTKSFKVFEGQKETIDLAIDKAKKQSGTDSDSAALEFLCTDYLSGTKKQAPSKSVTFGFDPADPMAFDLNALFAAIVEKSDDVPSALNHILTAISEKIPQANISVELEE